MDRIVSLVKRLLTRELIMYVVFGVLTTAVSIAAFWLCSDVGGIHYTVANIISWILAVTFAFFTNKFYVFRSKAVKGAVFLREMMLFYAARLVSLGIEEVGLILMIDVMGVAEMISKVVLQVVVIVLNYVFSKLVVFKKSDD